MAVVKVTIGSRDFNDGADSNGVYWTLDITSGWDSPNIDQAKLRRLIPGSSVVSQTRDRVIVCEGTVVAPSDSAHWEAYETLQTLVSPHTDSDFIVHQPNGARKVGVKLTALDIKTHNGRVFEFQLILTADDPTQSAYTAP